MKLRRGIYIYIYIYIYLQASPLPPTLEFDDSKFGFVGGLLLRWESFLVFGVSLGAIVGSLVLLRGSWRALPAPQQDCLVDVAKNDFRSLIFRNPIVVGIGGL